MTAQDWRSLMRIASQVSEEEKRRLLLDGIYSVVENWQGPLPDLLEIFRPEKIECLLSYAVTDQDGDEEARIRFIKFVVDTGYRDQPKFDTDGRYLLGRTTPIHLVLRAKINNWDATGIKMVHLLFEIYNRFDMNYMDETEFTHFQAACYVPNGHQLVVKFLKHGQNPNFFINGYSLLRSGLHNNREWTAELLRRGADPTYVDVDGSTALHTICRDGRVDLLNLVQVAAPINVQDKKGNTPLHLAIIYGHKKATEILLKRGADVNLVNEEGSTPLHTICRDGGEDLLMLFFEIVDVIGKPVWVNVPDNKGDTPLHLALDNSNTWLSKILLERGANPNSANVEGSTPLHLAITKEHHKRMKKARILLVNGANPNLADKDGCTALHLICHTRRYEVMKRFFEIIDENPLTVQIDAQNKDGDTPLHMALRSRSNKKFEMLLERGADPNVTNKDGWNALHILSQRYRYDFTVHFFAITDKIRKTVQIDAQDDKGQTPLFTALFENNTKAAEVLLRKGADPNLANNDGWTPLHIMCIECNWFLETFFGITDERWTRVEINAKTNEGRTPLNLLRDRMPINYQKASQYLERRGAKLY